MTKVTKVILWIIGIIGGLVILSICFGLFLYFAGGTMVEDASNFASSTDKNGCLVETATRASTCNGPVCLIKGVGFGLGCMEEARGNRDDFCVGDQAATTLPENYCAPYQSSEYCSQIISGVVAEFCKL